MKEFNLKDLFVGQKRLVSLKEELSGSSSQVITPKSLYLPILILFSMYNAYHKCFYGHRGVLDENIKADFVKNGQMVEKNLSWFSGAIKEGEKGNFQNQAINGDIRIYRNYKRFCKVKREIDIKKRQGFLEW